MPHEARVGLRHGDGMAPDSSTAPKGRGTVDAGACEGVIAGCAAVVTEPAVLHTPQVRGDGTRRRMLFVMVLAAVALAAVAVAGACMGEVAMRPDFALKYAGPSLEHPFGCDWMGRDMLARTLAGLTGSLFVGVIAAIASSLLACVLAAVAALGGARADAAVSFLIDVVLGIPHIVLLILVSYALGRGFWGVTIGVALTHWPSLTRVLRAEMLQLRSQPYMEVSRALGASRLRLACGHVVRAIVPQLVVGTVLTFPHAILHEASITFLGFGLSPDKPAIGVILSESMGYLSAGMWWLAVFPGAALVVCTLLFDRIGALARRLLDARTAQE